MDFHNALRLLRSGLRGGRLVRMNVSLFLSGDYLFSLQKFWTLMVILKALFLFTKDTILFFCRV